MQKQVFEKCDGGQVTEDMLKEASKLFNEHYGVWSKDAAAHTAGSFVKPGKLALTGFIYLLKIAKAVT